MSNKKVPVSNSVQDLIDVDPDDYTVEDLNKMAVPRSYINEAHAEFHSGMFRNVGGEISSANLSVKKLLGLIANS